jgi:cell fate (sporulation/competence/biofilm development) regulator YmcA (YheA/YmcA/DUF963 family)
MTGKLEEISKKKVMKNSDSMSKSSPVKKLENDFFKLQKYGTRKKKALRLTNAAIDRLTFNGR